jgi:hypothetical protein
MFGASTESTSIARTNSPSARSPLTRVSQYVQRAIAEGVVLYAGSVTQRPGGALGRRQLVVDRAVVTQSVGEGNEPALQEGILPSERLSGRPFLIGS